MLGPVQRIPRYRLLLQDYVKRLPDDAVDRQDAETALNLITKAATHSNETMKKIVSAVKVRTYWFLFLYRVHRCRIFIIYKVKMA